ncbi:hypothetical protein E4U43_005601 [Claviceps pusilla]|uniref:Six-bladed beta-propeller, TolB-like protein n=1 Tax=Claviceps pusilla TaxID=123648 RepID=A0A9P7N1V6_9HYPO|nr:hypothetical protein E4U43_005601 [Claviceps pusilla]
MANLQSLLPSILVVALSCLLYYRGQALYMFYKNDPGRLPRINTFSSHEIKFADRVRSCEDALIVESRGVAIVACDAGRERWNTVMGIFLEPVHSANLYVYDYKDASTADGSALQQVELVGFDGKDDFHTLGLAFDEASGTLFAVSHARAGSRIERFTLDLAELTATHTGTIRHPRIRAPNSIALVNAHELYVTNDHFFVARRSRWLSKLETMLALPLGAVVHVKLGEGEEEEEADESGGGGRGGNGNGEETKPLPVSVRVVARVAFANGIHMLNATTVAVAACSRAAVYLYQRQQDDASLAFKTSFRVPFLPDNLSVHGGKLYLAGHPHFPSLARFTQTRRVCNEPVELAKASPSVQEYCQSGAAAPSWVAEWSEEGGLRSLYAGTEYPSSATAAKDPSRGVGIVAGLYARGLLVWRDEV